MNNLILTLVILFFSIDAFALKQDSIASKNLELKIDQLENQLKEVRRDELNYQIEKDLLKETYSNNYERINLMITVILGIIGVLGFLGIRDINSIKKEYTSELSNLKQLQADVALKYKEFQASKEKYDTDLRDILKTNEEQNKKIKVLELKEKIANLFKDGQYGTALEFCVLALELSPNDPLLLYNKARINTRTRSYKDSIATYNKLIEVDPKNESGIYDLSEVLLFDKQRQEYQALIEKYKNLFSAKLDGKLLEMLSVVIYYQDKNIEKLRELSIKNIDTSDLINKRRKIDGWDLKDMLIYLANEPTSDERLIAQNLFWYIDGQVSASEFLSRTNIVLPQPTQKG